MVNPCRCGHEKGDHAMRIGQHGNYTPCCRCRDCDGFRVALRPRAPLLAARRTGGVHKTRKAELPRKRKHKGRETE